MNIIVERTTKACRDALNRHIFYNLPRAEKTAKKAAGQVSSNWTSTRDAGGLAWMTFKATCRRQSVIVVRVFCTGLTEYTVVFLEVFEVFATSTKVNNSRYSL